MSAIELTPILTIAYGNNCQGTQKGIGPNIYFGITKGIAYTVDFAIGFAYMYLNYSIYPVIVYGIS
jgi:hypothetical protein